MAPARIGVVTGANKGIGLAIVRQLALQYPMSHIENGSFLIYLTSRDDIRGREAVASLEQELLKSRVLATEGGTTEIKHHQLDISDSESIETLANFLSKEHPDGIDFVINNAGIALEGFSNTLEATRAWIPTLKSDGRIVNVASISGALNKYSRSIRDRFIDAKAVDDVTNLMEEFTAAVAKGTHEADGWPSAAYAVSKAGEIAQTRAIAKELKDDGSKILINSCHPGWVVTDMTKGKGTKTADQGAQTPVQLAIEDIGGKSGTYWSDEREVDWTA
ncbi:carbonyl reductase [Verticillium alfalfae VaMs.102]|uniref:Carbonyl reductase n=1 Tax=Verticillium alfalfae (strain VaMs.102 / ATCC MYA-4576 / FGSC 10136) TaxID=526221 RepID=C9SEM8_VERA1|nr:carbonyl reductase [Verticillium alfalfae VaMs.102]EEY16621.1 carbonyl reductase [Verticillium alfalfae VaMs.102]